MNRSHTLLGQLCIGVFGIAMVTACTQKPTESGGLSTLEREALLQSPGDWISLVVLSSEGEVSTLRTKKSDLNTFESEILSRDPGAVVTLDSDLEVERGPAEGRLLPDENLLFRGKNELGLKEWEKLYPESDGRNTVVGVVDDGVALHRPGLLKTSGEGLPKFAGSFNLSPIWQLPIRTPDESCSSLPSPVTASASANWKLPATLQSNEVSRRVAFDFSPCGINPELPRATVQGCASWKRSFPQFSEEKKELAAQAVQLTSGGQWRVLIDLDSNGEISAESEVFSPLSEAGFDYRVLPSGTAFAFDVHDGSSYPEQAPDHPSPDCVKGKTPEFLISLAVPHEGSLFGSHGEGVAAIAAGHRIGNRAVDGVAPGAQIFDVHFGDPVGSRRYTVAEITRALLAAGKRSDVVNLSYSLFFQNPATQLAMSRMMTAVLSKTEAVYFFSAGNNGPGRGSMNRALLYPQDGVVVGAYLDPLLAQTTFGSALPYGGVVSYSSRGPSPDGGLGAMVISPLAGMVPSVAESGYRPFSGTSSATPAMAGLAARLISQLKREGLPLQREWVRRALMESSRPLTKVAAVDQGWGLPWLPEALIAYRKLANAEQYLPELEFRVGNSSTGVPRRGIFVRGNQERRDVYSAQLAPRFPKYWQDSQRKADYAETVRLESDSAWIKFPPAAFVSAGIAPIEVALDWDWLEQHPGEHLAEVKVYSLTGERLRALLPVTVLVTESPSWTARQSVTVTPGQVHRWFIEKPVGQAKQLVLSREALRPSQPLCGRFAVYDPSGAASPSAQMGVNSSTRTEIAIAAEEPGIYEIVWVGGNSHTACSRPQKWDLHWQWIDLSLEFYQRKVRDEETSVSFLASTESPFLRGEVVFSSPSRTQSVTLSKQQGSKWGTWNYSGKAQLTGKSGQQWAAKVQRQNGGWGSARVARLPYWTLEFGKTESSRTWMSGTSLSLKEDAFTGIGLGGLFSKTDETQAVEVEFVLHSFEAGSVDEGAPEELTLELQQVDAADEWKRTQIPLDLTQGNSSRVEGTLPTKENAELFQWECGFQPAGYELQVRCPSLRF